MFQGGVTLRGKDIRAGNCTAPRGRDSYTLSVSQETGWRGYMGSVRNGGNGIESW